MLLEIFKLFKTLKVYYLLEGCNVIARYHLRSCLCEPPCSEYLLLHKARRCVFVYLRWFITALDQSYYSFSTAQTTK